MKRILLSLPLVLLSSCQMFQFFNVRPFHHGFADGSAGRPPVSGTISYSQGYSQGERQRSKESIYLEGIENRCN